MIIDGRTVEGDARGLRYLQSLQADESKVLFDEARDHGKAKFKYLDKHYGLLRTSAGTYVVTDLHQSSGFF